MNIQLCLMRLIIYLLFERSKMKMNKFRRKIERLIFVPYFLFKVMFIYKPRDIKRYYFAKLRRFYVNGYCTKRQYKFLIKILGL